MNCRTGCKTKDHESYAQCLQDANVRVAATMNNPFTSDVKKELSAYQSARVVNVSAA